MSRRTLKGVPMESSIVGRDGKAKRKEMFEKSPSEDCGGAASGLEGPLRNELTRSGLHGRCRVQIAKSFFEFEGRERRAVKDGLPRIGGLVLGKLENGWRRGA